MQAGQRLDGFGLMDYNARYYSSTLGRFVSPDSIIPQPGSPLAWDRYSYVYSNPVNGIDPSGHMPVQGCGDEGKEACHASDLENAINAQKLASLVYDPTGQKQEQNTKIAEAIIDGGEFIVSILFEPVDWVITGADCASGDCNMLALLGLLPGIPASALNKADNIAGPLSNLKRADYPWHHLFPKRFKEEFKLLKIEIDKYLVSLPLEIHKRIHSGARGGAWNEAWLKWLNENPGASPEDVFKQVGVMIYEFGLDGNIKNVPK